MLRKRPLYLPLAALAMACVSMLTYCDDESPTESTLALNNCTSCHLNQDQLVATAAPDDDSGGENSGEG